MADLQGAEHAAARKIRDELGINANIEKILSLVRLREAALGSTTIDGLDSSGYGGLGKSISEKIGKKVSATLPKERNAYDELISWVSSTTRTHAVEIFTTNYDLLFEEAFEQARAPYFDGFSGGNAPFFDPVTVAGDDLPARWSRLWKLHGSLGWALENGAVVRGRGKDATQLIYPDHLKYDLTQKQPYAALFERLKRFLLTPDALLLTTGFSFRDAHVCAVLDEALAMNANSAVFAFQYQSLAKEEPVLKMASNHPNLSVYAADGAVISGISGIWRPGELAKNWEEIRASFWGLRGTDTAPTFLLGDFSRFTRFCALAQATELQRPRPADLTTNSAPPLPVYGGSS
ncbi:SIR2 family protein [Methylobacterium sp.]|uniref:SIR2 family NAD-dependent protein deacylase n=1 Tax=Methylobacterium sp. TaxID=409 RepID=UPI0025DAD9B6|nr:SIR2 family protein [Methylobacterium sp.]